MSVPRPEDEIATKGRMGLSGDALALRALDRARSLAWEKGLRRTALRPKRTGEDEPNSATSAQTPDEDDDGAPGTTQSTWTPGPALGTGFTGPGRSPRDPRLLGNITNKLIASRGWKEPLNVASVVARWRDLVGDNIADHCDVETFDGEELVLRASSTAWATQIRLLLPRLEQRIAAAVGEGVVQRITVLAPGGPTWKKGPRTVRGGRGPRDTYG